MATPGLARNCEVAVRVKPEDKEHPVDSEVPTTRAIEWDGEHTIPQHAGFSGLTLFDSVLSSIFSHCYLQKLITS